MEVTVKYFGHLRDLFGKEESYVFFKDSKSHLFSEILSKLTNFKGGEFLKNIYSSDSGFNPHISVILNGKVVTNDKIKLNKDCSILFFPFILGG